MSTSKLFDKICIAIVALTLIITILFMNGSALGIKSVSRTAGYETNLFDTSRVHTIDIVMNDWDDFIETCENEEYSPCTVVIDGEKYANVAIRAKGNTSLSNVKSMGSQRYSFKLEFDHYDKNKTYKGLDKLCLNNLIQDNTMMKDYLVYQLMNEFGVESPLCSYVYITVNGEDWGLYLAVEGIEDSFLQRNYGSDSGTLYKPDSMSFGGGRGNGKDFNMDDFDFDEIFSGNDTKPSFSPGNDMKQGKGGFGGMGSDDVKLKYIDDDPDSYSNIFDNAKTDITDADKQRLISSLKNLSEYKDLENTVNIEEVIRYFVVHNFVCNGDSYTGSMVHNYYLHENDGIMSMIPWDYNLAFGTFQGNNASSTINEDINEPTTLDDRPMLGWIFSDEQYTELYHELFAEFITKYYINGELEEKITATANLIRPYAEKDPTRFCTTEEFEKGVEALTSFVTLRAEAVANQLNGIDTKVDTTGLNLSDMGTMGGGMGGGMNMPGNMNMPQQFDVSSMITITDENGNEVDLSSLLGDSQIASVTLSDGTTMDIDKADLFSMGENTIASIKTTDGTSIDMSHYTITLNTSSMPTDMFTEGGPPSFNQNSASLDGAPSFSPNRPGRKDDTDATTSASKNKGEGSGMNGMPSFPGNMNMPEGGRPSVSEDMPEGSAMEQTPSFPGEMTQGQNMPSPPENMDEVPSFDKEMNTMPSFPDTKKAGADMTIPLLGISFLVLIFSLIYAIRKK
ncbi:MAG: CotH kinase family protein [Erysipelotrichaceae bacterium]|nr:CotH kinase family protein [Erysipelotrichaceae bacterium]